MAEARLDSGPNKRSALGPALIVAVLALLGTAGAAPSATSGPDRIAAGGNAGPRIFATGDSMMRYLDGRLKSDLERIQDVSFRTDVRIGSGISKDNWVGISRQQVRQHRPRATIVFIGAADGFHMPGAPCCRKAWIAEYADRVTKIIRAYARKGQADVYWLTLPAPQDSRRQGIFRAVNRAIRRAARSSGPAAHIVDTWAVFTPGGRYRRAMSWKGERGIVRTPDGVHLTSGGHAIASQLIRDALRKDGITL